MKLGGKILKEAIEDAKGPWELEFIELDVQTFKEKVLPQYEEPLLQNSKLKIYL